jgi:rhamnogalacturonyl hydrolase YesR
MAAERNSTPTLRAIWWRFEGLVREALVEALRRVPAEESERRAYLTSLYDLTDSERAEQLRQSYKAIKDREVKQTLIDALKSDS